MTDPRLFVIGSRLLGRTVCSIRFYPRHPWLDRHLNHGLHGLESPAVASQPLRHESDKRPSRGYRFLVLGILGRTVFSIRFIRGIRGWVGLGRSHV